MIPKESKTFLALNVDVMIQVLDRCQLATDKKKVVKLEVKGKYVIIIAMNDVGTIEEKISTIIDVEETSLI